MIRSVVLNLPRKIYATLGPESVEAIDVAHEIYHDIKTMIHSGKVPILASGE